MSRVGLIGVGLLGTAIAERLLAAGFDVIGYDLAPDRRRALEQLKGTAVSTPGEVASSCDRLILSLPTSEVAERVVAEIRGYLAAGTIVIDTTTGEPEQMAAIGAGLEQCGGHYLDATVAGSSDQVRRGESVLMIGGDRAVLASAAPVLEAMAPRQFHVGNVGSGARMKLVVNLVLGLNRAVLAEGLNFARCCGLNLATVLDVLRAGPAYSTVMDTKGAKMLTGDFVPQARLAQHHKDVQLILKQGATCQAPLPLSTLHEQLLQCACELGFAAADNSAIIKAFEGIQNRDG